MREIPLTQGYVALVDDEDYDRLMQFSWRVSSRKNYAAVGICVRDGTWKTVGMHRMIMSPPEGMEVDHIDGNGLNNQRSNLRICTHAENLRNQRVRVTSLSGIKGVSWCKRHQKWHARIKVCGKCLHLGYFANIDDARLAHECAARKHFGEFARVA